MIPLLIVNSIGLTGSEILTAALSQHPRVRMLPGQNFIGFGNCLYRRHSYASMDPGAVFDSLAEEYLMTSGRVWSGLTKDMESAQRSAYDRAAHRRRFVAASCNTGSLLDEARVFGATYFDDSGSAAWLGFFGQNLVLSHGPELEKRADFAMLGCTNRIEFWLANISQRMTWDCTRAACFWLVNHLLLLHFARGNPRYMGVDVERLVYARADVLEGVWRHLGLEREAEVERRPGFITFNERLFAGVRRDAEDIAAIYGDIAEVSMARSMGEWGPDFLAIPENVALLARYREYWNSTSHTNFDWIGPIEEKIVARAREVSGAQGRRNPSLDFYHRYHRLDSLSHAEPKVVEPVMLGCLEEDIVVPLMPFFLKVCIEYLTNLARIAERQAHSYRSLRAGSIYARLAGESGREAVNRLNLGERMAALEQQIDRAEAQVGRAGARRAPGP